MNETQQACAHCRVSYRRIDNPNGTCSDSWRCNDCGTAFWPGSEPLKFEAMQQIAALQSQLAEAQKTYNKMVDSEIGYLQELAEERAKVQPTESMEEIAKLANFIMENIPGEPSASESAVDVAIRLLREERAKRGELILAAASECNKRDNLPEEIQRRILALDPSASQAFDATKNSGPVLDKTPAGSGRPVDLSSTADRGALARFDAMQQREQELREAFGNLLKYLDDHDWGTVPEGETAEKARAALSRKE